MPSIVFTRYRQSLGRKFALGFGLMLVLLLAVAGVSQLEIAQMEARIQGIVEIHNHRMAQANQLIAGVDDLAILVRTISMLTAAKEIDRHVRLFDEASARYVADEQGLQALVARHGANPAEFALLDGIRTARLRTIPLMARATRLGADGATPEATALLMNEVLPVENRWRELIGQLIALEARLNAYDFASAREAEPAPAGAARAICELRS